MADLAPRDVVSRAIIARMRQTGTDHVFLDCRHLGAAFLAKRFPSIVQRCGELGFDPATDLLPVAPAQHYASGGVRTDLRGRTSLDGLYACGETSCTGVHGANRLASNSLLEGLVFARRIADDLTARLANEELPTTSPVDPGDDRDLLRAKRRLAVQRAMTAGSGTVRSATSLAATERDLAGLSAQGVDHDATKQGGPKSWETTNLLHLGRALTYAATLREETRGGHVREDFPTRDDAHFLHHLLLYRTDDGELVARVDDVPASNLAGLNLDNVPAAQPESANQE